MYPAVQESELRAGIHLVTACRAPIEIRLLSPEAEFQWDRYVERHRDGTVFHTTGWRNLIARVYQHPSYLMGAWEGERMVGALPLYLVRSSLAGRMMISTPYGVGGGVLADNDEVAALLKDSALQLAAEEKCALLEFRSEHARFSDAPALERYLGFVRRLPDRPEDVLAWIPRKARAAARNAREKHGLTIAFRHTDLRTVWRLYTRNMRRLGSIAYPFEFFAGIRSELRGMHWVCLVHRKQVPIASLVTLLFGERVMPYLAGFSPEARTCGAANFLYYSVMKRAVACGYRIFDFGRSRADNTGSCSFKRFHGFNPVPLGYQRWRVCGKERVDLSPSNPAFGAVRRIWRFLPLRLTEAIGGYLSRHIPG